MNSENNANTKKYRPELVFYHPTAKGTGCAVKFSLHAAVGRHSGCIMMKLANQETVGKRDGNTTSFPTFNWEKAIIVKLGFMDLSQILQVFRGECESLNEGRGLYHRTATTNTRIILRHIIDPGAGYSLEVYRNVTGKDDDSRAHIVLGAAEAMGLEEAISGSMAIICFGVPGDYDDSHGESALLKEDDHAMCG